MMPKDLEMRKLSRKLQSDSPISVMTAGVETFTRKYIGTQLFNLLVENNIVNTSSGEQAAGEVINIIGSIGETSDKYSIPILRLDSGYILPETGLVLNEEFDIIEESAGTPNNKQQLMMEMLSRELFYGAIPYDGIIHGSHSSDPPVISNAAPLIPRYPKNYYHWMVETAPKIRYIRNFQQETGMDVRVVISRKSPTFVRESLSLLDWPESQIVKQADQIYEIKNLIVPPFPTKSKVDFNWLRNEMTNKIDCEKTKKDINDRIYIRRTDTVERRVTNEDEVIDVLKKYDFNLYNLEDRTLCENIKLFNNSNIVVGPHGAGLTDIIFASECTLIEFFGKRINKAYKQIANRLDITYEPMYCQTDSVDIIVDTEELDQKLSQAVKNI